LALTVLLIPAQADACSCIKEQAFEEAIQVKEEVFLARVVRYSPLPENLQHGEVYDNQVHLTVVEVFKGPAQHSIEASARIQWIDPTGGPFQTSSCTLRSLDTARVYVIARNAEDQVEFGYCSEGIYSASPQRIQLLREEFPR
jgi:hypothetical protein